jgi:hypothetical protein
MKRLVLAASLALGLFGFADTASAQVIVTSPGYGWGGGYYPRPVYPGYGWGGYRPPYYSYPRTSISFSYGYPAWGYGYGRPWGGYPGYGYGGFGYPGYGYRYGGYGYPGYGYRPGISVGVFIR